MAKEEGKTSQLHSPQQKLLRKLVNHLKEIDQTTLLYEQSRD